MEGADIRTDDHKPGQRGRILGDKREQFYGKRVMEGGEALVKHLQNSSGNTVANGKTFRFIHA